MDRGPETLHISEAQAGSMVELAHSGSTELGEWMVKLTCMQIQNRLREMLAAETGGTRWLVMSRGSIACSNEIGANRWSKRRGVAGPFA